MMNRRAIYAFLLPMLLLAAPHCYAQSSGNKSVREMNYNLYKFVGQFEQASSLYDEYSRYDFLDLFESPDSQVYCDLLEYKPGQMIPVSEYISKFENKSDIVSRIYDVTKSDFVNRGGQWEVTVNFEKRIQYTDVNGVLFSSFDHYGANNSYSMACVYNEDEGRFRIKSISGKKLSDKAHLPGHFKIVQLTDAKDRDLTFAEDVEFNIFDQAVIENPTIEGWNEDVIVGETVKASSDNYELINLTYKYTHMRAKARFGYAFKAFSVDKADNNIGSKSNALEFGVDIGLPIHLGKKSTLVIYTGAAYNLSTLDLSYDKVIDYSLKDTPFSKKSRSYLIVSGGIKEHIRYKDLVVPLYVNLDLLSGRSLVLNASLGAKLYVAASPSDHNFTVTNAASEVNGIFSEFGKTNVYRTASFDYSLIGGLGMNYGVVSNKIYVSARLLYEYGLVGELNSSSKLSYMDGDSGRLPFRHSEKDGNYYASYSLIDCATFRRNAIWGELSVIFKF